MAVIQPTPDHVLDEATREALKKVNTTAVVPVVAIVGGTDLTLGVTSLVGLGLLGLVNLARVPQVRRNADALVWE